MIVYLRSFIFIAILRGNLGKSEPGHVVMMMRKLFQNQSECDLTEQEVERELEIELEFI